jgi:dolichol kinase
MLLTIQSRSFCLLVCCLKKVKIIITKNIILSVVLYGCQNWFLTLREEHRLRMFEMRMLRRIFGPNRDEVTGGWRKTLYGEAS